jgi:hypothetical protein
LISAWSRDRNRTGHAIGNLAHVCFEAWRVIPR